MENQPRIVLMCGGPFAYRGLSALAYEKYLAGVVIGTKETHVSNLLQQECEQSSVPFLSINGSLEMDKLSSWLDEINPDAVFSICFPYMIPAQLIRNETIKFINFHTGPLPSYRGPMPIFEVIRRGEKETAMSAHFMTESYDTGSVIYAETLPITKTDTFTSLALKLSERCGIMVSNMAEMLQFSRSIPSEEQDQSTAAFYPFPNTTELKIDWNAMSAEKIIALINACNGWNNGAITSFNNDELHLITVAPEPLPELANSIPGTVIELFADGSAEIACLNGQKIKVWQLGTEDGLYSFDFLKQLGLKVGVVLGSSINLN